MPNQLAVAVLVVSASVAAVARAGGVDDPKFSPCSEGLRQQADCLDEKIVTSEAELADTLASDFIGCVIVPNDAVFDMTGKGTLTIRSNVSLIGERGKLCSRPTIFTDDDLTDGLILLETVGNDSDIRGIHFRGPAHSRRDRDLPWSTGILVRQDNFTQLGRNIVVEDCELDEWTSAGVAVASYPNAKTPAEFDPTWPHLTSRHAGLVLVTHNYLHHNARDGEGYGVAVTYSSYATILGNVFDYNRHAIASDGWAYTGYVAHYNYVLDGGYKEGNSWNQHFDVHGVGDGGYGESAGAYFEIANNTFRGDQDYYWVKDRAALMLRGTPTNGAYFNSNVCTHGSLDGAVALKSSASDTGWSEDHDEFNFHATGNDFSEDRSGDVGVGDFDGDGRDDAFVATGTAWFFSPAGIEPWIFLHASDKRRDQLGLVDIDNDGITDVLYRDSVGDVGWLKSGRVPLAPLTTSPVEMNDMRFGDFDGDGLSDIFYTADEQWWVWYGATHVWTWVQHSKLDIDDLLFGEFDVPLGTDVLAVVNDVWSISNSATGFWAFHGTRWRSSFDDTVAADFDGDGITDVAYNDDDDWLVSYKGQEKPATLRKATGDDVLVPKLAGHLIGSFDGGPKVEVMSYHPLVYNDDELRHFRLWRGDSPDQPFEQRSRATMR